MQSKTKEHNVDEGVEKASVDHDAMGADYEESEKGDEQVHEPDDNDIVVVKDEDREAGGLLLMYGASLVQPLVEQVCRFVSEAVKDPSVVFTAAGRVKLEKNIKQIASSVLGATDPNTNLETEEAQTSIEETASRASEPTAAGRLKYAFPIANLTGDV